MPNLIRNNMQEIMKLYIGGKTNIDIQRQVRKYFDELKIAFENFPKVKNRINLIISYGIGIGRQANIPWIAFLDKRITTTTQKGEYVVILFRADMSGFYLTFNQGVGRGVQTVETGHMEFVEQTKILIRSQYPQLASMGFGVDDNIDLRDSGSTGKAYEKSTIAYKYFPENEIPSDDLFSQELEKSLSFYDTYVQDYILVKPPVPPASLPLSNDFLDDLETTGLRFNSQIAERFIGALCTKPFVILTGLSGSGKTKLAQAFSKWICSNYKQYILLPVGADWTNREPLLGYPNALSPGDYVTTNGVLDLLLRAEANPDEPHFLILDEMNLSHVERYFADFLSAMETGEESIILHSEGSEWQDSLYPSKIKLPENLFIIGTVNIDETTYMFSPKVLDRAVVIEFRVTKDDMGEYLNNPGVLDMSKLVGLGASMAESFVLIARTGIEANKDKYINDYLLKFFEELKKNGAEFGYRTASDINRFTEIITKLTNNSWTKDQIIDAAIIQKLLPKIHGSRKKLEPVLKKMAELCLKDEEDKTVEDILKNDEFDISGVAKFPLSLEKIQRMYLRVIQDGFTSFAEA